MAKRPIRSEVNDTAAPAQQKPSRRSVKQLGTDQDEPRSDPQPMAANALSMSSEPTEEDIRMRAYQLYVERGGHHGADFEDWVRAEEELRKRRE